jgi:hypothetical protein
MGSFLYDRNQALRATCDGATTDDGATTAGGHDHGHGHLPSAICYLLCQLGAPPLLFLRPEDIRNWRG